jgi:hypothetical protein
MAIEHHQLNRCAAVIDNGRIRSIEDDHELLARTPAGEASVAEVQTKQVAIGV